MLSVINDVLNRIVLPAFIVVQSVIYLIILRWYNRVAREAQAIAVEALGEFDVIAAHLHTLANAYPKGMVAPNLWHLNLVDEREKRLKYTLKHYLSSPHNTVAELEKHDPRCANNSLECAHCQFVHIKRRINYRMN